MTPTAHISLGFAGLAWKIHPGGSRPLAEQLRARYGAFIQPDERAGARPIELECAIDPALDGWDQADARVESGPGTLRLRRGDFDARFDLERRHVDLRYGGELASLHGVLRAAAASYLALDGGLLLHGSSVVADKRALAFVGPSGTGKTTLARLGGARTVLSDEASAIVLRDGYFACAATPFWGDFERPVEARREEPLERICFPIQADENSLEPASPGEAVRRLLHCVFFFGGDEAQKTRVVDTCVALARRVPCSLLRFRHEPSIWEVLHAR